MTTLAETLYKIPLQYEAFRKSYKRTKEQIKQAHYNTGLSDYEIMLIHAYCANAAIERLKDLKPLDQSRLDHEYYWLKSWKDVLTFDNYSKAINHLVDVCAYWSEANWHYAQEWMLEAEGIIYDRLLDFIYKGHRPKSEGKSYDDIKQRIGDI
jgi:hypothetical protein